MNAAPDIAGIIEEIGVSADPVRRTRKRPKPISLTEAQVTEVVERVVQFFADDDEARSGDKDLRIQRYAKMMQYASEVSEPYPGAANTQLSDILAAVLRTEDTLQNSAIATRPMVNTKAISEADQQRERKADLLLDTQFFVEQDGEGLVEQASMNFVRDGFFVALTRWVRELRKNLYTRTFSAIPTGAAPEQHFRALLERVFSPATWRALPDSEGWDWEVVKGKQELLVRFYTEEDGDVTMQVEELAECFCGPKSLVYDYEDVLAPAWSLNLQPPGPSNPHGAPHVLLVDYPTKDEILRGIEQGYYDRVTIEELEGVEGWTDWSSGDRELDRQRRMIRGGGEGQGKRTDPEEHQQMKRILCFDLWGGLDVVWTVLVAGQNYLLRADPLTEFAPGIPPRRPLAHACMIPVQGTWVGMGLPELMESMHDFLCQTFNLMHDATDFEIYPILKYRQSSNLKPEQMHLSPGKAIPMSDPQRDLVIDRLQAQAVSVCANMIALGEDMQEKLTSIGDIQLGRIPTGKSAALRTASGVQQVLAQGEARPERILRRFFKGLTQIFAAMYRLDRHFLPDQKAIRVVGVARDDESPFLTFERHEDLVDFLFDFHANVLNSSKVALQASLNELLGLAAQPLMLQLGISTPDTVYRILADYTRSLGQMGEKYWTAPTPGAQDPPIFAEDAVLAILKGQTPRGAPAEGSFEAHQARIAEVLSTPDEMGVTIASTLTAEEQQRLGLYLQQLQQQALQAQMQAQLLAAAQQFQGSRQQGGGPGEGAGGPKGKDVTLTNRNEVRDESLPSSGTPQ